MIKGLLVLFGVFVTLMALLIFAKSRPAQALPMFEKILAEGETLVEGGQ